jgi:hypothetical protein
MIANDIGGTINLFDRENAWTDASGALHAQYVIQPFYKKSEVAKRAWARRVFALVSLLLVSPLTSDRDGDR